MGHEYVQEAEDVLDKEFPVLDKGHVVLIDYMGSDQRIVDAARISYGKGTTKKRTKERLVNHLTKSEHTSPIEQVELVFGLKMPLFVVQQMLRHRTAHVNQMSARYSIMEDEYYLPIPEEILKQDKKNRQGGTNDLPYAVAAQALEIIKENVARSDDQYRDLLSMEVCRQQARMVLPANLYTSLVWKIDLHNFLHFARLRRASDAQPEIQQYANTMFDLAFMVAPIAVEAYEEFIVMSVRVQRKVLKEVLTVFEKGLHDGMVPLPTLVACRDTLQKLLG